MAELLGPVILPLRQVGRTRESDPALGCQALEKDWVLSRTWLLNFC